MLTMSPAVKPEMTVCVETLVGLLNGMCENNALTRTQSAHKFQASLSQVDEQDFEKLSTAIAERLRKLEPTFEWQVHAGTLLAAVHAIPHCATLLITAQDAAIAAITHAEPRVRSVASNLLASVAEQDRGERSWGCVDTLLAVVRARFEIGEDARLAEAGRVAAREAGARARGRKLNDVSMVHETEGWKGLETALLALKGVVEGCGKPVFAGAMHVDDVTSLENILSFVIRAKEHQNRFVREAGLRLLTSLINASPQPLIAEIGERTAETLAAGLQDNWSQVRYSASECTRALLSALPVDVRRTYYPVLLPRMCLNRHYVAEGVRVLSQSTWRNVIGSDGRQYLVRYLTEVIAFFESQCAADNHAVREAACQSLGEVAERLDREKVSGHVARIIGALVDCFKDESWPVRDHACRAISGVVATYPVAAEQAGRLTELYDLFLAHLADNIPSVRENCAAALVRVVQAYPPQHKIFGIQRVADAARKLLLRAQAQSSQQFVKDWPSRNTGYGAAAKLARDNDVQLHTGQVMYSCGSLAPKLRRGGGCMDHGFSRPKQPWEEADGGLRLWRRIAAAGPEGAEIAGSLLKEVASVARIGAYLTFAHQSQLAETVWTQVADGLDFVGEEYWTTGIKRTMVRAVEKDRNCGHARVQTSAAGAIRSIRRSIGFKQYENARSVK